jgi:hypothetical protein
MLLRLQKFSENTQNILAFHENIGYYYRDMITTEGAKPMLGYVRADVAELRVREHQYYRALYCGLCHRMGKCTGQCSRMTLSYDFVLLAALRLSLTKENPTIKQKRCMVHPLRKRPTAEPCEALDFCADASALLTYHKLLDDLQDEKGFKRLRAWSVRPFLVRGYRRAKRRRQTLDVAIADRLATLSALERDTLQVHGADEFAACFGDLMAAVFADGLEGVSKRLAQTIGRAVGRWIYLADAADDFLEDCRRGRFNPYRGVFGERPSVRELENLRLAMTAILCEAENALSLMDDYPTPELREILANILYLGMPNKAREITEHLTAEFAEADNKRYDDEKGKNRT